MTFFLQSQQRSVQMQWFHFPIECRLKIDWLIGWLIDWLTNWLIEIESVTTHDTYMRTWVQTMRCFFSWIAREMLWMDSFKDRKKKKSSFIKKRKKIKYSYKPISFFSQKMTKKLKTGGKRKGAKRGKTKTKIFARVEILRKKKGFSDNKFSAPLLFTLLMSLHVCRILSN